MTRKLLRHALLTLALLTMNTSAFAMSPPQPTAPELTGRGGPDEWRCVLCLTGGILIIYTGAPVWPMLLQNTALVQEAIGVCVIACASAYGNT